MKDELKLRAGKRAGKASKQPRPNKKRKPMRVTREARRWAASLDGPWLE